MSVGCVVFLRKFVDVPILFKCKLMSPNSCAVLLPSKQPPSCSVTYIVAIVMRLRDSTNVWNFPFIFTDSVELKGYALIFVFFSNLCPPVF